MNRLLTILLLLSATAHGQIDNPPTTGSIGLGPTNDVTFNRVVTTSLGSTTNPAIRIGASNTGFYSPTNGYLYLLVNDYFVIGANDDSINFSEDSYFYHDINVYQNAVVGGTLAVTGNVTLSGVNNTMPNATNAASASSLMTRELSDDRYRLFYVPLVHASSSTATNGSTWNLRPFHSADAVFSAPPWARNVRVYLSTAFTNAPITNNFTAVITAYAVSTTNNTFGSPFPQTTNALSVTQVWSNGSNSYRFILTMTNNLALPSEGISDAESASFWNILIQLRNNSSGSLTTVADNWLRGMAVFSD